MQGERFTPIEVFDLIFGKCNPDSVIAIGSRRPTKRSSEAVPHWLIPVRVRDRHLWLPEVFASHADETQYLMLNTLSPGAVVGTQENVRMGEHAVGRYFYASNQNVAELCAVTIDLDYYRLGKSRAESLGAALTMALEKKMPMPAMMAHSGQGAYLCWLLRDEGGDSPPQATPHNTAMWQFVTDELVKRTEHLGADPKAKNVARWFKRPGTIDTKTDNEVTYVSFGGGAPGSVVRHTLGELQKFLNVYHAPVESREKETVGALGKSVCVAPLNERVFSDNKRSGRKAPAERERRAGPGRGGEVYRKRVAEIKRLSAHRGGFHEGVRAFAVWIFHKNLRACLQTECDGTQTGRACADKEAESRTIAFSCTFKPPLPQSEVVRQINSRMKRFWRGGTIAEKLHVTVAEAEALGLEAIAPAAIRRARQEADREEAQDRKRQRAEMRAHVEDMIREGARDSEIFKETGAPRTTVNRWRQEHAREERGRREEQKKRGVQRRTA